MTSFEWLFPFIEPVSKLAFRIYSRPQYPQFEHHKSIFCWHQGKLVDYFTVASRKNETLNKVLLSKKKSSSTIIEKLNSFEEFLDDTLHDSVFPKILEQMEQFYSTIYPSTTIPRICIKQSYTECGIKKIYTIAPKSKYTYENNVFEYTKNSASVHIEKSGKYFLCNNIPKYAKKDKDRYLNPRLNPELAMAYSKEWKNKIFRFLKKDKKWIECWNVDRESSDIDFRDYYKSTLVIPITVRNNDMSKEFLQIIAQHNGGTLDRRPGRGPGNFVPPPTFGYLCLDSFKTGFFKESRDMHFGYFMADILSLYLYCQYVYTNLSTTYRTADEYRKNKK